MIQRAGGLTAEQFVEKRSKAQLFERAALSAYAATDPEGAWPEDWAEIWFEKGAGQPLPPTTS